MSERELPAVNLEPKMLRFCNLFITGNYDRKQLSEMFGVHVNTLGNWLKNPEVNRYISEMQDFQKKEVAVQLNGMTLKAVNKLNKLVDSRIDGVALQAVKDVLDRGGHKPKQEIEKNVTVISYEQQLSDLMKDTIDVDFVDVEDES